MFTLETTRLRLRRLEEKDLEIFASYRADPAVSQYQSWGTATREESLSFIKGQQAVSIGVNEAWTQIGIARKENDELVGDCALRVHDNGRQAEYGITLAKHHQGHGYATEALHNLFTYCFTTLNLHRIFGIADIRNTPSIAVMKRLNMRQEAHTIQAYWNHGEWVDEVWYAVLKNEWEETTL